MNNSKKTTYQQESWSNKTAVIGFFIIITLAMFADSLF